jgi:hypothetical protein
VVSDGERLFEAARTALESGDAASAAVRLGLVIRLAPELAPQVVVLIGDSADPGLLLVSGDAHAAIGDDPAARAAYRAALAATAPAPVPAAEPEPAADPVADAAPERPPRRRRKRG